MFVNIYCLSRSIIDLSECQEFCAWGGFSRERRDWMSVRILSEQASERQPSLFGISTRFKPIHATSEPSSQLATLSQAPAHFMTQM